jgi:hypothetical protein
MMTPRPRLISNRFEVVLLILLSFVVSTRLIWLQIDEGSRSITDEFYSTSLAFNRSLGHVCSAGVDPDFPHSTQIADQALDSNALTSPGLALMLWGLCQIERLNVDTYIDIAPHLITMSAFFVAVTARLLTANWVGGLIAAAVVLSRGSVLSGTHLAGTFVLLQPLVCLIFLLLALYARTRDARWLPPAFAFCATAIFVSPLFALLAWPMTLIAALRAIRQSDSSIFSVHKLQLHLISMIMALIVFPLIIMALHIYSPSSTRGISTFISQLPQLSSGGHRLLLMAGSAIAELEQQDLHWQISVATLALAAALKRFLPSGSGFCALMLLTCSMIALVVDGGIIAAAARQSDNVEVRRIYNMTDALFSLEPLVIGLGASYAWFAVRYLIILVYPDYSSHKLRHGRM